MIKASKSWPFHQLSYHADLGRGKKFSNIEGNSPVLHIGELPEAKSKQYLNYVCSYHVFSGHYVNVNQGEIALNHV